MKQSTYRLLTLPMEFFTDNVGVYKITCDVNGMIYIGKAVNLMSRWAVHTEDLIRQRHKNKYLQADFNRYGANHFSFEVIEYCSEKSLFKKEFQHLRKYLPEFLYNSVRKGKTLQSKTNKRDDLEYAFELDD